MSNNGGKLNRRTFLGVAGAGAAAFTIVPSSVLGEARTGTTPPSETINVVSVGAGGRAASDIGGVARESGTNIIGLADIDPKRAAGMFKRFDKAEKFTDFRKMLDKLEKQIDAVIVGTPDHTHAVACMNAIKRGKHVYCEKPLTHTVAEVRALRKAAIEHKVITQVGNQGHASEHMRMVKEWVADGAIGNVTEAHLGCDAFRNVYCQIDKLPDLKKHFDVPAGVDWDLWLGPITHHDFKPFYHPWNWRGWTHFGTGTIGDWICHVLDPTFWALDLGLPTSVQADTVDYDPVKHEPCYPGGAKITWEFPAKGKRKAMKVVWHDGKMRIPKPAMLEENRKAPGVGGILLGDNGLAIQHGSHGAGGARIIPEKAMKDYKLPEKTVARLPKGKGHHWDWLDAIRNNRPAGSSFEYGGAMTEVGLLGMIAIRMGGKKLQYDAKAMRFTNSEEANKHLQVPYRAGWTL